MSLSRSSSRTSARVDLLCVGHTNLDHEVTVQELPKSDRTVPVQHHALYLGGTASNIARWSARSGLHSGLSSFIGEDFPAEFWELLRSDGVDVRGVVVRPGQLTPTCWIARDQRNRQVTFIDQGAMGNTADLPLPPLQGVKWVHLATGDPRFQLRVARAAVALGIHVSSDPAQEIHYRWSAKDLAELLSLSEILFGNHHELDRAARLLETGSVPALVERVPLVVETLGAQGAQAHSRRGTETCPPVRVRNPQAVTGAGDAFRAGFYSAWLGGRALPQCLAEGCAAGATVARHRRSLFLPIDSRSKQREHGG